MTKVGNLVKFELYGKKFIGEVIGRNIYKIDTLEDTCEVLEEKIIANYIEGEM